MLEVLEKMFWNIERKGFRCVESHQDPVSQYKSVHSIYRIHTEPQTCTVLIPFLRIVSIN